MDSLIEAVQKNGGTIVFDLESYVAWKERETTVNQVPDVPQKIRPRYRPEVSGSGRPPFVRVESEHTSLEYKQEMQPSQPGDGSRLHHEYGDPGGHRGDIWNGNNHDDSRRGSKVALGRAPEHRVSMRTVDTLRDHGGSEQNGYAWRHSTTWGGPACDADRQRGRQENVRASTPSYRQTLSNGSPGENRSDYRGNGPDFDHDRHDSGGGYMYHVERGPGPDRRGSSYNYRVDGHGGRHHGSPGFDGGDNVSHSNVFNPRDSHRGRNHSFHDRNSSGSAAFEVESQTESGGDRRKRSYADSQGHPNPPPQQQHLRGYALEPDAQRQRQH